MALAACLRDGGVGSGALFQSVFRIPGLGRSSFLNGEGSGEPATSACACSPLGFRGGRCDWKHVTEQPLCVCFSRSLSPRVSLAMLQCSTYPRVVAVRGW